MKYADLHIHSNYSDGSMSPEKIIENAINLGVRSISITDHDCISSQYVTKKIYTDIKVIPGIELSAEFEDIELINTVNKLNKERIDRISEILFKLKNEEINLNIEDLEVDLNSTVGRSHVAKAMVKKGYYDSYKVAFTNHLVKGKASYVKGYKLNYKEAIQVINNSGGIPVLAHPGQIYKSLEVENIIKNLKFFGLKGIEVYHPSHSKEQTNNFYNLAKKYKLLITGGSDFHGKEGLKENLIGSYGISKDLLNKLINLSK